MLQSPNEKGDQRQYNDGSPAFSLVGYNFYLKHEPPKSNRSAHERAWVHMCLLGEFLREYCSTIAKSFVDRAKRLPTIGTNSA